MRTFACVLHSSRNSPYDATHVKALQRQVEKHLPSAERFVCFTNLHEIEGVETKALHLNLPGKYSMMEVFFAGGPCIVTGLDTIFMKNMDRLFTLVEESAPDDFFMMDTIYPKNKRKYANGIMAWNGDWSRLIYGYDVRKALTYRLEMDYTIEKLLQEGANIRTMAQNGIEVISFKKYMRESGGQSLLPEPNHADVVVFHGFPRPHNVALPWVEKNYWCND